MEINKIILIGAGNVATHLAIALKNAGFSIVQVYSRDIVNAEVLAGMVEASAIDNLKQMDVTSDMYILSVSDGAIETIAHEMPLVKGVVVHTAGSVPMEVLNRFNLYGVFYPFQTFTKDKELDFKKVPVLIEGNISHSKNVIIEVAQHISTRVQKANGEHRKALHIAAVFACNFVNHLYVLADDLLEKQGMEFSLLEPLISETTRKALSIKPVHAQTGPARRNDKQVIQLHQESLNGETFHHDIYALISESIIRTYETERNSERN
ncbi:Rossmann-like and DUF2520 domain-containing protein [Alkalitalea saponilacus]|uniref:Predicted oxidoreductase, contains short-chain dehydrogenase (SDR) and DUF2520 domains n=1 Tax=Alkalitalea saponilacus TaxID=889453 RepID=A0A1T5HTD8_9BACT|nr:Rossmann-like and DUF2520 domain-containing protein [Alkalitalea saponilacus]ASB50213.1 hypothetical protein CDL62_14235 [Alkalitalea saponilacus]SKC23933.1 Predicted oxidoreductase, contains short-chain dehydrogenase (SDR) and DUF2520 domains [Alkalitalea saponilacus]